MNMYVCMDVCMYANVTAGRTTLCRGQHVFHDTALTRSSLQDAYMQPAQETV